MYFMALWSGIENFYFSVLKFLGIRINFQNDLDLSVTQESIECGLWYEAAVLKLGILIEDI